MRYSQYFIPTVKETPSDAEVISHKLMLRAGMIRKLAAGIYNYLPFGLRSIRKVEAIVREEMNRAGAIELLMPAVQPAELWKESGRWEFYGKELLRFNDRKDAEFCMGPTHEEVITDLIRKEVRSYRQLPINLYQIQGKFRDEIRPRFGLMRGREFIMKDAYSFDVNEAGADVSYEKMYKAYRRIFERCGLKFRAVEADTGTIGGSYSHEFMVLADSGEDAIVSCSACEYAANMEKAETRKGEGIEHADPRPMEHVSTPGQKSIEDVATFLGVQNTQVVKTLVLVADGEPVVALIRGDYDLNEIKLKNHLGCAELEMAEDDVVVKVTGAPTGYAGPVGLAAKVKVVADLSLEGMHNFVTGANAADTHLKNVNIGRDFSVSGFVDIRNVVIGDACPRCDSGKLEIWRGIEVGHVFKLGTKYSKALKATFLDADGKEQIIFMGCYGIGVGRTVAACIEQNHDENGIIFPIPIAPFQCIISSLSAKEDEVKAASESIYQELLEAGIEVLLDDRDERPGFKFKDADLIGIPLRIVVGAKALAEGKVELKERRSGEVEVLPIAEAIAKVKAAVKEALQV
ncbi:prolyl-tRNA synthetase [Citrifermentans bemidjiense Bem]|uniref:Proline--tRNA ligase n=1 Tax=Citrifermentans bemidjiense (strain ATCC BAA-1014 / DSM 16622 / JCM 12645 / Bem) TaxID=404380 RepID=SYP_CITBB|nr:proline--tRNA ligase [Citrifermentans bemidjiense]B5EIT9.1 RecName: Full=Proline--tRNA ligase; AltName: Full=Prolyl-tRNA synthetase; Short=ProRS [Citrifermentans bemidjiense Bem]ACH39894.1 prolyl-tRNA synthetase [Citrifermentans bemidjiense Bem]